MAAEPRHGADRRGGQGRYRDALGSGRTLHGQDWVEDAVKRVYGVKAVANDITVEVPGSLQRTDADIAAAALNALKWDFQVPEDAVKIIVRDGCVSLEGTVDWQYQKDAADRCVRYLTGVLMCRNLLAIKPRATESGVRGRIVDAFRRSADLDARRIDVETFDGRVTLTGSVSSWSERDEAESAAWAAPGVTFVDDRLVVVP